ncbi:MAG: class I SAM-dependent methyltransferase [Candidatus Methanoperedens sp.]|nr:class I SAM-dependent methyltransferase [Candidatus Methanoperedens sp.]
MTENKSEWESAYSKILEKEQSLELEKQSPENLIDWLKMEYLNPYLPKEGIIVEVGAGSGRLLTRIGIEKKKYYQLIGIDYFSGSTKLIKGNISKFNLNGTSICADAYHLPLKSNSVNAVVSGGLLEHFNEDEIKDIIQEMVRVLKPDGLFYAEIVPNKRSLCRPVILTQHGGYENTFSKEQWNLILNENGLVDVKTVSGIVIPPNFYVWYRSGFKLKLVYKLKHLLKKLDNTVWANMLGFSYYAIARKRT